MSFTQRRWIDEKFVQHEEEENPFLVEIDFFDSLNEPSIDTFDSPGMIHPRWLKKISMI